MNIECIKIMFGYITFFLKYAYSIIKPFFTMPFWDSFLGTLYETETTLLD